MTEFPISNPAQSTINTDALNPPVDDAVKDNYSFEKIKDRITKLSKQWKDERALTDERRELRYLNINCEEERRTGRLKPDEIYIPIRLIDDNIRKEAPQYIAYLTTSRNAAVFKPRQDLPGTLPVQVLESVFTKMCRYNAWEIPFFKELDGTQTHGWASIEIVFDASKPGHFAFEYIAHEDLWFSVDLDNTQRAPFLARNCKMTKDELLKFPNVNTIEVEKVYANLTNDQNHLYATMDIQKVFYKNPDDGLVYVCWLAYDKCSDFIRPPQKLYLGRDYVSIDSISGNPTINPATGKPVTIPIYETSFPIEIHLYVISENNRITAVKGRAFLDEYIQEATSSLISSIVNGWHRASQTMASPTNPVSGGAAEETDIVVRGGKIYTEPLNFFNPPYPDINGLKLVESLVTQNQAETSTVNFAVNNREDSRKTAREISAAQSQAALLSGVQVTLYSIFLRNLWTRAWSIVKSQAEQGLLTDYELNKEYLQYSYDIFAAGDSEVITRDEQLSKLQQAWPVFANTPAAPVVLRAIVDLGFPMFADDINKALMSSNPTPIVASISTILEAMLQQYGDAMSPEDKQKVMLVMQQAAAYLQQNAQQLPQNVTPLPQNAPTTPSPSAATAQ